MATGFRQHRPATTLISARRALLGIAALLCVPCANSIADDNQSDSSPNQVKRFFDQRGKVVITFVGYSGSGYEDVEGMLSAARGVLSVHSPKKAIVNIGATSSGIGAVYAIAKEMGFETAGIVSTQARKYGAEISSHVDTVFYVTDDTWGGFNENTMTLAPTSLTIVQCSDIIVGIGGGPVARDEMVAAQREGKTIKYIPAEMHHKTAIDKARSRGRPIPTDFRGAAFQVFGKAARSARGKKP